MLGFTYSSLQINKDASLSACSCHCTWRLLPCSSQGRWLSICTQVLGSSLGRKMARIPAGTSMSASPHIVSEDGPTPL